MNERDDDNVRAFISVISTQNLVKVVRDGKDKELYSLDCNECRAHGNHVVVEVTIAVGGCGALRYAIFFLNHDRLGIPRYSVLFFRLYPS